jgi:hypothetical protein
MKQEISARLDGHGAGLWRMKITDKIPAAGAAGRRRRDLPDSRME